MKVPAPVVKFKGFGDLGAMRFSAVRPIALKLDNVLCSEARGGKVTKGLQRSRCQVAFGLHAQGIDTTIKALQDQRSPKNKQPNKQGTLAQPTTEHSLAQTNHCMKSKTQNTQSNTSMLATTIICQVLEYPMSVWHCATAVAMICCYGESRAFNPKVN